MASVGDENLMERLGERLQGKLQTVGSCELLELKRQHTAHAFLPRQLEQTRPVQGRTDAFESLLLLGVAEEEMPRGEEQV